MALGAKSLLGPVGRLAYNPKGVADSLTTPGAAGYLLGGQQAQVPQGALQPQQPGQAGKGFPGMPAFQAQSIAPQAGGGEDEGWLANALKGAKEFALGTPGGPEQLQNFQPWQQYIQYILGNLGLENSNFGDIEKNEVNRFNRETIPGIAERFQGMPGSNQNSSGFQSSLGSAGAQLGDRLAALRSQYGMQQLQFGLQPQFENIYKPPTQGALQQLLPLAAKAGAAYAGLPI